MIHNRYHPALLIWIALVALLPMTALGFSGDSNKNKLGENHYYIRALPEPIGFAFADEPTTGGSGGLEVTVTTAEELLRFATSDDPYVINVVDTIEIVRGIGGHTESNGEYHLGSNTTLRGVGPHATILYGGFRVSDVENVIIQNLNFDGTYEGYDPDLYYLDVDCRDVPEGRHRYKNGECLDRGEKGPTDNAIEITEGAERVWITQNSFRRYSDEVMSVKRAASYVTISWNRFDDHVTGQNGMMILIGSGDNHYFDRGRLRTTLHHNYMASRSRHPRVRYGIIHVLNNYYHNISSYGIAATMDSEILVEGNYFENTNNPWHIGFGSSPDGYLYERDNIFQDTNPGRVKGTPGEEITPPSSFYSYSVDDPEQVPSMVLEGAGAAGAGDFSEQRMPVPALSGLVSPVSLTGVPVDPQFEWRISRFAETYQIQIKRGIAEDVPAIVDSVVSGTEFHFPEFLPELKGNTTYFWRVRAINDHAEGAWTAFEYFVTEQATASDNHERLPDAKSFELLSNYPNPFNSSTTLRFHLPESSHVRLQVYDITGREIAAIINRDYEAGYHSVVFDAGSHQLSSGVYLYRLSARSHATQSDDLFIETRKMSLVQ